MPNFFSSPQIQPVSNYEPPGYSSLRNSLMNQIGARQINPYGLNNGQQGGSQYNPYQGRGTFNPYTGQTSGGYGGSDPSYGGQGGGNPSNPWAGGGGSGSYGQQMGQMGGQGGYQQSMGQMGGGYNPGAGATQSNQGQQGPGMQAPPMGESPNQVGPQQGGGMGGMQALMQQIQGGQKSTGGSPQANVMNNPQVGGAAPQGPSGPPSAANNWGGVGQSAYDIYQSQQGQNQPAMQTNSPAAQTTPTDPMAAAAQKNMQPGPAQLDTNTNATQANMNAPQNTHPGGTSMMTMPQVAQMIQGQPNTSNPGAAQLAQPYNTQHPNQVLYQNQSYDGIPGNPGGTPTGGTGGPAYTGPSWSQPGGGQDAAQQGVDARQALANSGDAGRNFIEGSQQGPPPPPGGGGNIGAQGTVGSFDFNSPRTQYDATPASTAGSTDPSLIAKLMALLHLATGGSAAPQAPAMRAPAPTPTPTPPPANPQNTTKGLNMQTQQQRADDITNNNDGIKYDGSDPQPYPDESSPQPYDGRPMSGGVASGGGMHIHAPMAQVHPQGVASAGPPGLNKILGGMASANRHGQMAAYRAGKPGVVYDGANPTVGQVGGAASNPSTNPSTAGAPSGSVSAMPTSAQTAGASMYPWMQSYQGNLTAPMSNEQNQALSQQSQFAGSNPLSAAGQYNQQLLSGAFMPENNANIQQIQQGMLGTKNQQDADAQQQIASSMAAGGNALSGARLAANAKYQDQSNNNYNTTMGQLQYNNLQNEQALRNQGVGQAEGLTSAQSGLNQSLMNMGSVPQQIAQSNDTAQYNDWLRQVGAMQQGDQQNTTNAMNLLKINPGGQAPQYGTSQASSTAALLSSLLGGSGSGTGGVLGGLLNALGLGSKPASTGKTPGSGGGSGAPSTGGGSGGQKTQNPDGTSTDENGNKFDKDGNLLDPQTGQPITGSDGQPITTDQYGNLVDSQGNLVDSSGNYVQPDQGPAGDSQDMQYPYGGVGYQDPSGGYGDPTGGGDISGVDTSGGGDYSGDFSSFNGD